MIILKLVGNEFDYNYNTSLDINIFNLFVKKYDNELDDKEKTDLIGKIKKKIIRHYSLSYYNFYQKIKETLNSVDKKITQKT